MKHLKALIVEDSEDDALMLLRHLKLGGYEIEYQRVQTAETMENALHSYDWQIVFSDYSMPRFDGLMALAIFNKIGKDIPFIVISGTIGEETAVQAMLAGVDDYFIKGNLHRLIPAVERELKEAENRRERKRTELELFENKKRLQLALNSAGMGVWEWDLQTDSVYWSPECFEILGVNDFNQKMDGFVELLYPDDVQKVLQLSKDAIENHTNYRAEFRIINQQGEIRWLANNGLTEYDESGKPLHLIGTVQDITERKKAETLLRESEENFRAIIQASTQLVWQADEDGTNKQLFEWYSELSGQNITDAKQLIDIIHPDDIEIAQQAWQNAIQEKSLFNMVIRVLTKNNGYCHLATRSVPIFNADGSFRKWIGTFSDITDRMNAEESLRESEELNRAILNSMISNIAVIDRQGKIIAVNEAWRNFAVDNSFPEQFVNQIIGVNANYLSVCDNQNGEPTDESEEIQKSIKRVLDGENTSFSFEYPCHSPHQDRWFLMNITPLKTKAGGAVVSHTDISSRKLIEDALRKNEAQLKLVSDTVPTIIVYVDTQLIARFVNEPCLRLFGVTEAEALGKPMSEIFDKTSYQLILPELEKALTGEAFTVERPSFRGNGESYLRFNYVPDFDEKGTVQGFFVFVIDLTDNKRAEEELRKSELRFRSLVNSIAQIVWTTDADGALLSALTPRGASLKDTGDDLMFEWTSRLHPDDKERAVEEYLNSIKTTNKYKSEYRMLHTDGTYHHYISRGTPVYEKDGTVREWVGTLTDISDSKISEENLRKSEEQLRQAQKLESVGRLAGGIAHDFNNMLTAINGYSDLTLRRLDENDPIRRNIEEIKKAGERSATLTQQLLAFSRRQILQVKVLDINQIISDSLVMFQRLIGEDIQIVSVLNPLINFVKADAGQLSQMLLNLVVNSRDAMPTGGTITIETDNTYLNQDFIDQHAGSKPGNYVRLAVSDDGIGIDEETLQQIFEPFFTTKEIGKGTGLGLSTVYGIVNQLGGYILVNSMVGTGTTFEIYLPAVRAIGISPENRITINSLQTGNEMILLVEDEELVRNLSRQVLEACGYIVIEAKDGFEALELCQKHGHQIELLLTDVVMPLMSGRELAEKILQIYPNIKILFSSGYTEDAIVQHGVRESEMNFIQKPFSFDELAQKVRELLDSKKIG